MKLTKFLTRFIFFVVIGLSFANNSLAAAWQRVHLGTAANEYDFPVYANHDLNADLRNIREVILILHGAHRDGDKYFATALSLLKQSGRRADEILLLAPNFPGTGDRAEDFKGMPAWHPRDWAAGLDAQQVAFSLSSFKVLDDLLLKITDETKFPSVTTLTLAGHSAGGQFIQRYAVLNNIDEQIRSRGLELKYVVANPSSFLYFTPQRPDNKTFKDYPAAQCPDFNQYRYGTDNMIPYAAGKSGPGLFKRYSHRSVTYLMGMQDTNPQHSMLDKTCPALAQGPTRLSRAQAYVRYERFLAGRATRINHLAYQIVGVGHDQAKMFGSICAVRVLFQTDPPQDAQAALCEPDLF